MKQWIMGTPESAEKIIPDAAFVTENVQQKKGAVFPRNGHGNRADYYRFPLNKQTSLHRSFLPVRNRYLKVS